MSSTGAFKAAMTFRSILSCSKDERGVELLLDNLLHGVIQQTEKRGLVNRFGLFLDEASAKVTLQNSKEADRLLLFYEGRWLCASSI